MADTKPTQQLTPANMECTNLEQVVANTCFCKLREACPDKSSPECMKHRNLFAEFMLNK